MTDDPLVESLEAAVAAAPDDLVLRRHLAEVLVARGRGAEAVGHCARLLAVDPGDDAARRLMALSLGTDSTPPRADPEPGVEPAGFDWSQAEEQVGDIVHPAFVTEVAGAVPSVAAWDVESATVTLADVGGMTAVKERLEAAFLAPMRNPELRRLYGKSLKGGLLLYGPPGCGKTFIARAVAGELGAGFLSVGINDVLDMWLGNSEANLHEVFQIARRNAPCVLFLDEIDGLGQKRSMTRNSAMRTSVNQLLTELDGIDGLNEGVFVLAATNQPWDVDAALRRPGRFDRTLLVLPPDEAARATILTHHLKDRPLEGIDVNRIAKATEGYSGADLAHLCDSAAEMALLDGVRTGTVRMIHQADLEAALTQVHPSIGPWLDSARTVVRYGSDDGTFGELKKYLKLRKMW